MIAATLSRLGKFFNWYLFYRRTYHRHRKVKQAICGSPMYGLNEISQLEHLGWSTNK